MTKYSRDFYYPSADGLQLYCRIYDAAITDAPTVLCLPGLTRNSRDFVELATHLQSRYRVLALDLRGRGRSAYDLQWQNYQPGTYLADIAALCVALNLARVNIIGTSLGALLAMVFAAQQPSLVGGIVLNDAGPEIDPNGAARIARYVGLQQPVSSWQEAAIQARQTYGHALPDLTDEQWLSYTRQGYRESEDGKPIPDSDPNIGQLFRSGAATPQNLWPVFTQLKNLPMLVIRGATSDILSAATVRRMAEENPGLQQLTVANRGHAPLLNEPECVAAIDKFLAGLMR
ncbi:MAG TPA: alpha/beta hydrolase [Spongiibacteraceae bacterium]|nr:alpha/beta hydrolase [Spongiibacteraceae bacterium]